MQDRARATSRSAPTRYRTRVHTAQLLFAVVYAATLAACGAAAATAQTQRQALQSQPAHRRSGVRIPLRSVSRLRVMSFNVRNGGSDPAPFRWEDRLSRIASRITDYAPDLLGLQETTTTHLDTLVAALPGYGFLGVGNADGAERGVCNGLAFLEERLDLLERGVFWLSDTPEQPGSASWGNREARAAAWAVLRDRDTGQRWLIYNTHLDHVSEEARARGLELIGRDLASRRHDGPALVIGDLNLREDDPALVQLLAQTPLRDSYRVAHPERRPDEATYHGFRGETQGSRIDFVLATDDLTIISSEIVHPAAGAAVASDHFAVTSTVQLRVSP